MEARDVGHQGDWADSLLELDTDFGVLLDLLLDLAGNTLVVFAGNNGPEEVLLWRGTPGYWEGSYFAGTRFRSRPVCGVSMRDVHDRSRGRNRLGSARPLALRSDACRAMSQ